MFGLFLLQESAADQFRFEREADGTPAAGWLCQNGHGLWLARQVADEMSVVSGPGGTCATVFFALR